MDVLQRPPLQCSLFDPRGDQQGQPCWHSLQPACRSAHGSEPWRSRALGPFTLSLLRIFASTPLSRRQLGVLPETSGRHEFDARTPVGRHRLAAGRRLARTSFYIHPVPPPPVCDLLYVAASAPVHSEKAKSSRIHAHILATPTYSRIQPWPLTACMLDSTDPN